VVLGSSEEKTEREAQHIPPVDAHFRIRIDQGHPIRPILESQKSRKRSHFWMSELLRNLPMSGDRRNKTFTLLLDILFTDVYLRPVGLERCAA